MPPAQHERLSKQFLKHGKLSKEQLLRKARFKPRDRRRRRPAISLDVDLSRRLRRSNGMQEKKRVLQHRFGSLDNCGQVHMTIAQIAVKMRMPWSTVNGIIGRFVSAGHSLDAFTRAPRHFKVIPDAVQSDLADEATLRTWKSYSLRERIIMIEALYGIKISFNTLQSFYKARNISHKSCKAVYRTYL